MASLTVYVLTNPAVRGPNYAFYALNADHEVLEATIYASSKKSIAPTAAKIKKETYVMLKNATVTTREDVKYARFQADTIKVFQTGKAFDIPQEVLDTFYKPPSITIPEALASPRKRKLSIEGEIIEVKAVRSAETWQRRDVTIKDNTTSTTVQVKLWNQNAQSITEQNQGSNARFTNLEVDIYNNHVQLKSLDMTSVEIIAPSIEPVTGEYEIIGVDSEEDIITIITTNGREMTIGRTILTDAGKTEQELIAATPIMAKITSAVGIITNIEFI